VKKLLFVILLALSTTSMAEYKIIFSQNGNVKLPQPTSAQYDSNAINNNRVQTSFSSNWKNYTFFDFSVSKETNTIELTVDVYATGSSSPPIGQVVSYVYKVSDDLQDETQIAYLRKPIGGYGTYILEYSKGFEKGWYKVRQQRSVFYVQLSAQGEILNAYIEDNHNNTTITDISISNVK